MSESPKKRGVEKKTKYGPKEPVDYIYARNANGVIKLDVGRTKVLGDNQLPRNFLESHYGFVFDEISIHQEFLKGGDQRLEEILVKASDALKKMGKLTIKFASDDEERIMKLAIDTKIKSLGKPVMAKNVIIWQKK
jgi:hypothetical protein